MSAMQRAEGRKRNRLQIGETMNEKTYDPERVNREIREARWQLFQRIAVTVSVWASIVVLFGSILLLIPR